MQINHIFSRSVYCSAILSLLFATALFPAASTHAASFVVMTNATMPRPNIVLQYSTAGGITNGWDWGAISNMVGMGPVSDVKMSAAVHYLQDAIKRMTTNTLTVVSSTNLSKGIVFTTLAGATLDIRTNAAVIAALTNTTSDPFYSKEAFYITSDTNRLLIVANNTDGLASAMPDLMESVNYEVLGMGPRWNYAEPGHTNNLIFNLTVSGRAKGFYIRYQSVPLLDYGTIYSAAQGFPGPQPTAPDENVDQAYYWRWQVGTHQIGSSMPASGGQALYVYHPAVFDYIRTNAGVTNGFLASVKRGLNSVRPANAPIDPDGGCWAIWVNTDTNGAPAYGQIWIGNAGTWVLYDGVNEGQFLDLSVSWVRGILFQDMKLQTENSFSNAPADVAVFDPEGEDGSSHSAFLKYCNNRNWYPTYRTSEGQSWGAYALNGWRGLVQPTELWDTNAESDTVFGNANWLLREYDKYVNALPLAQRKTSAGLWKTNQTVISLMSYDYHDVPPNFNLAGRVMVQVGPYPKNRGLGKWAMIHTFEDVASAFKILVPKIPSAEYLVNTYVFNENTTDALVGYDGWSSAAMVKRYTNMFTSGVRSMTSENALNFGRFGLNYYLTSKILWNPQMGTAGLESLRNRWFLRAYGAASTNLVQNYYDYMLNDSKYGLGNLGSQCQENFPCNSPGIWGLAIDKLDKAAALAPAGSVYEQRFDDLKQYWYLYSLIDIGSATNGNANFKKFILWKGQQAYMIPELMCVWTICAPASVLEQVLTTAEMTSYGASRYTHAEMTSPWSSVKSRWPKPTVKWWTNSTLTNGVLVKNIDNNDLVRVSQFKLGINNGYLPFYFIGGELPSFYVHATNTNDKIGFKVWWPVDTNYPAFLTAPYSLSYGVDWWDTTNKIWTTFIDPTTNYQASVQSITNSGIPVNVILSKLNAPHPGTYRFYLPYQPSFAASQPYLAGIDWDIIGGTNTTTHGQTIYNRFGGSTQSPVWIYIPKGTTTLDFEVWDDASDKTITFYTNSLIANGGFPPINRTTNVSSRGVHKIVLQAKETGNLASITGASTETPYFYSIPNAWCIFPDELMIPRAVATADGLTILP